MISPCLVLMSRFRRGGSDIVNVWQHLAKVRKVIRPKTRGTLGLLGGNASYSTLTHYMMTTQ